MAHPTPLSSFCVDPPSEVSDLNPDVIPAWLFEEINSVENSSGGASGELSVWANSSGQEIFVEIDSGENTSVGVSGELSVWATRPTFDESGDLGNTSLKMTLGDSILDLVSGEKYVETALTSKMALGSSVETFGNSSGVEMALGSSVDLGSVEKTVGTALTPETKVTISEPVLEHVSAEPPACIERRRICILMLVLAVVLFSAVVCAFIF